EIPRWEEDNDPVCKNCAPFYATFHGDVVSGTAAATTNNTIGVSGTNWYSRIMATKAGAKDSISEDKAVEAMAYGIDNGADVINMSFSGLSPMPFLYDKIYQGYHDYDMVLVGSVGNDSSETIHYPAYYDEVIGVAGTDSFDVKRQSSTYGTYVEVSAPGENWCPGRTIRWSYFGYFYVTGTSISTPFVSGLAGLIKGQYHTLWSGAPPPTNVITNDQIRAVIDTSSDDIYDIPGNYPYIGKLGFGRINTLKALLAVSRGEVNNDRQVSLADVSYMINFLFKGGPPPIPDLSIMDFNCNGICSMSDAVYLVNYLYKGGDKSRICFEYDY
ncbi:MAG: S8 family serine peptidase, partial [Candidatus Zixiibacteriota bacterium]